jgi:hypothetical protein
MPKNKEDAKQLRWSRGRVLAFRTQVHGFKPGEKILITPPFGREVNLWVPYK